MKRLTLWLLAAAVGLPSAIQAQGLTMQMSNGWKFSFSGNVNAFAVYSADANGGQKNFAIRTGLLPGFAVFDAKGHEGNYDLGVHVGFAPQIQNGGPHDALAQIDMRQLYLTVGMKNGSQLLAGRELGVFLRQNILNDMTLYGTGAQGGVQAPGTTLGRIGYGYLYPNFEAQITYSSAGGKPTQFTVGLFEPSTFAGFGETELPRVEAEVTHAITRGRGRTANVWVGGSWQTTKPAPGGTSLSSIGVAGGVRADVTAEINVTVAAYYTKGNGALLQFDGNAVADPTHGRPDEGGYVQVMYKMNPTTQLGASWGISELKGGGTASGDGNSNSIAHLASYTVGWYHNMTRSLKTVVEATKEINRYGGGPNRFDVSAGLMLFF
jgi:hypothetical protein